uniref:Uncharacterized protein n=1 Tax=Ditylenchus dipsaci TaxID=166011 RepID=A0A915DTY8_9BILA
MFHLRFAMATRILIRCLANELRAKGSNCRCFATFQSRSDNLDEKSQPADDALQQTVRTFVREEIIPKSAYHDSTGEFPWDVVKKAHALGLMNSDLPKDIGGTNLSLKSKLRIFEEIAYGCTAIGTSLMVNELAQIPLIQHGSDFVKDKYLKRMLKEPLLASYAVSEPEAGSDVANITTKAQKKGDYYLLNGSKIWITNGGIANWYFVLARTNDDPKARTSEAFTGFVLERETEGVSVGRKDINMGQRCSDTRTLSFKDVKIPAENVVGEVGHGFQLAMKAFDRTRPIVAVMACGLSQRALDEAAKYAVERKTFGKRIAEHQGIAFKLADMAMNLEAAREITYKSAEMVDTNSEDATYYSSCAKCFAADKAFEAAANAVQILGGNGFSCEYPVEKLLRDAKLLQIYGGTCEIQRKTVWMDTTKNFLNIEIAARRISWLGIFLGGVFYYIKSQDLNISKFIIVTNISEAFLYFLVCLWTLLALSSRTRCHLLPFLYFNLTTTCFFLVQMICLSSEMAVYNHIAGNTMKDPESEAKNSTTVPGGFNVCLKIWSMAFRLVQCIWGQIIVTKAYKCLQSNEDYSHPSGLKQMVGNINPPNNLIKQSVKDILSQDDSKCCKTNKSELHDLLMLDKSHARFDLSFLQHSTFDLVCRSFTAWKKCCLECADDGRGYLEHVNMMCDKKDELQAAERCLRKHAAINSEKCDEQKIELNQKYSLAKSQRESTAHYNEFCRKAQKLSSCLQDIQLGHCPAENVNRLLEFERKAYPSFQTFLHRTSVADECTRLESFLASSEAEHPDVEKLTCCRDKLAQIHMTTHKDNISIGLNLTSSASFDYLIDMKLPECLNGSGCKKSPLNSVFDYLGWMKTNKKPLLSFANCSISSTKRDFTEPCRNAKAFYQCAETNWRKICIESDVNLFFELEPMVLKSAMTIAGAKQAKTCIDLQTYFEKSRIFHAKYTMSKPSQFIGRTAFVTGAGRGIGLGLVKELAKDTSFQHIFAGYYEPHGDQQLLKLQKEHSNIKLVSLDVTNDQSIQKAVKYVETILGENDKPALNLLINVAAILVLGTSKVCSQEPDRKLFLDHFNTNTLGSVMITASVLPLLRRAASKGCLPKVVNISSTAGSTSKCYPLYNTAKGMLKNFPYGMSKAALNHYTKALAMDEPDIVAVAMCPGWVKTEMGGPNAVTSVEECASALINKIKQLSKLDTGKFMDIHSEIPY